MLKTCSLALEIFGGGGAFVAAPKAPWPAPPHPLFSANKWDELPLICAATAETLKKLSNRRSFQINVFRRLTALASWAHQLGTWDVGAPLLFATVGGCWFRCHPVSEQREVGDRGETEGLLRCVAHTRRHGFFFWQSPLRPHPCGAMETLIRCVSLKKERCARTVSHGLTTMV